MDVPLAQHQLQSFKRRPCSRHWNMKLPRCLPASGIPQQCVPSQQAPTFTLGWRGLGQSGTVFPGLSTRMLVVVRAAVTPCPLLILHLVAWRAGVGRGMWPAASSRILGGLHIQLGIGQSIPKSQPFASVSPSAVQGHSPMLHPSLPWSSHAHAWPTT